MRSLVKDGKLIGNYGNPYHPYNTRFSPIPYATPVAQSLDATATVCGKSKDIESYLNNPYRLLKPLKRSGPRGSGMFEPVEWEQMIKEIADGGKLFEHIGESRYVKGLKELNSDELIDKDAPELGSVRNTFVFIGGRDQDARKPFSDRFVKQAFGSVNRLGHTDICGIGFRMGNWIMSNKKEVEFKADPVNAEFIAVFGANIYEALQPGINTYGATVANRSSKKSVKFVIVDPRATNAAVHAEDWIAVKPTQDGALAMGMLRWIIENKRVNTAFLSAPSADAAKKAGFSCATNASHLVVTDTAHKNHRKFLRYSDINPAADQKQAGSFVVMTDTGAAAAETVDAGKIDFVGTVTSADGKPVLVQTAFSLMKQGIMEHTVSRYADMAGVRKSDIERLAKRFTSHGTKAAVTQYHGAGNYIGGTYAAYAVAMLNTVIGSVDRKGGYMKSSGGSGKWNSGLYDLTTFPGAKKAAGPMISREKFAYEKTTEFKKKGYPSKRPWFPMSLGGLCVEAMSGIDEGYPYRCNLLMTYFFNPVYSIPGGYRYEETLKDTEKVPLHVSIDITVNESNLYADYIVPDITYPEGHYGFLTPHAPVSKFTGVRTPVVEPLTGRNRAGKHYSEETFFIDLALAAGLPGFGENAIKGSDGKTYPLLDGEDYYLRAIANLAENAKAPEASSDEVGFVERNYPAAKFKGMLTEKEWRKVCYVLARGGVFDFEYDKAFDGEKHKFGIGQVLLYSEELALTRNSITGQNFNGTLMHVKPKTPKGRDISEIDKDYPFSVVTFKMNLHAQSRTHFHKNTMEVFPENFVIMNEVDAVKLNLHDGDSVRVTSFSNTKGVVGKIKTTKMIRPECVAVSFHYGHRQMGATDLPIKGADSVFLGGSIWGKSNIALTNNYWYKKPGYWESVRKNVEFIYSKGIISKEQWEMWNEWDKTKDEYVNKTAKDFPPQHDDYVRQIQGAKDQQAEIMGWQLPGSPMFKDLWEMGYKKK